MKFKSLPVTIEAEQLTWDNWTAVCALLGTAEFARGTIGTVDVGNAIGLDIPTLEGTMHASENDWIIKGLKGEFYPCKPDVFALKYEAATE